MTQYNNIYSLFSQYSQGCLTFGRCWRMLKKKNNMKIIEIISAILLIFFVLLGLLSGENSSALISFILLCLGLVARIWPKNSRVKIAVICCTTIFACGLAIYCIVNAGIKVLMALKFVDIDGPGYGHLMAGGIVWAVIAMSGVLLQISPLFHEKKKEFIPL